MFFDAAINVTNLVHTAQICHDPFDHVVINDLFPQPIYNLLTQHPVPDQYLCTLSDLQRTNHDAYQNRRLLPLASNMPRLPSDLRAVWQEAYQFIQNILVPHLINRFASCIKLRLGDRLPNFHSEVLYVRDSQGYALGPHTDHPRKVFTFLIYLAHTGVTGPGTSFYKPRSVDFTCAGGPHYKHEGFELVMTTPYRANTMLAFAKTDRSFHGVEKILDPVTRNLLICDVQLQ